MNTLEDYYSISDYLVGLKLDPNEIGLFSNKLVNHKQRLEKNLGRDIGCKVAALDYFQNIVSMLQNPKIIEGDVFDKLISKTREDFKTGCYNIQYFREIFESESKRSLRYKTSMSVILLDIDDFKKINDTYGHTAADLVLNDFVNIINSNLRTEDVLARFGGDEFIILLPQINGSGAVLTADRLKKKLVEYFNDKKFDGTKIEVSFSGGIGVFPQDADNYEDIIKCADNALYSAKRNGKNMVLYLNESKNYSEHGLDILSSGSK
jgi:diguanylate cyclase (GGDEF)-like protein